MLENLKNTCWPISFYFLLKDWKTINIYLIEKVAWVSGYVLSIVLVLNWFAICSCYDVLSKFHFVGVVFCASCILFRHKIFWFSFSLSCKSWKVDSTCSRNKVQAKIWPYKTWCLLEAALAACQKIFLEHWLQATCGPSLCRLLVWFDIAEVKVQHHYLC